MTNIKRDNETEALLSAVAQSKHTPVIYAAHCDTVRNQEPRINDAMPALRFQNGGQELAIITLSGYTKGKDINEMSQMEWAKHLAMCSNAHDDLVAALQHLLHNAINSGAEMGLAVDVAKTVLTKVTA